MSQSEVFDSVLWDTPPVSGYDASANQPERAESSSGPGYRQESVPTSNDIPKWEGYLDVEVKDPVKELEHTKDAYVSYLVVGRVSSRNSSRQTPLPLTMTTPSASDRSCHLLNTKPTIPTSIHRLCLPTGESRQRLPCLRRTASARKA